MRICPSICFENTVPHLIRRQVRQLKAQATPPDVLVTITNDGWFWGSSLLDLHLACGTFRAIETRLPRPDRGEHRFLGLDRRQRPSPRPEARDVRKGSSWPKSRPADRVSLYLWLGDWFAGALCLLITVDPRRLWADVSPHLETRERPGWGSASHPAEMSNRYRPQDRTRRLFPTHPIRLDSLTVQNRPDYT